MFKKIILWIIFLIQKMLLFISLTLIYFIGFGITLFFMKIFSRRDLAGYSKDNDTFWIEAKGYEADIEDSMRQS